MAYLGHLNRQEYREAENLLEDRLMVKGPMGEAFRSAKDFIGMLEKYRSGYDIKKTFSNGHDVCVLYDFVFEKNRVYASSLYEVRNGKISSVTTVFDSRQMP